MTWSSKDFFNRPDLQNPGPKRAAAFVSEIMHDNVPTFLSLSAPENLVELDIGIQVMQMPLAIGNDDDYVFTPLEPYALQFLADHFHYELPTPKLVDMIWKDAGTKLAPYTPDWNYVPPETGTLARRFYDHTVHIRGQLANTQKIGLLSGIKKDVVSDERMLKLNYHRVVIYGWHQLNGHPIQNETNVHSWDYVDYSHSGRMVRTTDPALSGPCCLDIAPPEFTAELKRLGVSV